MGGRSGQSVRTGQRFGQNIKTAPADAFQRSLDDINNDINRERQRRADLNTRLDNATTDEEEDQILQDLVDTRRRIDELVSQRQQIVQQQQQQEQQRQAAEQQRQAEERSRQRQEQERQQRQQNGTQDYNATIGERGTNRFPQFSTGDIVSFTGVPKDFGGQISVSYIMNILELIKIHSMMEGDWKYSAVRLIH